MYTIENSKETATTAMDLCPRCEFHPVSPRAEGYCSWDCYDADDEEGDDAEEDDGTGEQAA